MFILSHSNQLIKTISLIGEINNTEFLSFLRKSSISLEYDFIPADYAPSVKSGKQVLEPLMGDQAL